MFVFSSVLSAALWFVVRFAYDLVAPRHRLEATRRRFWTITLVAAVLAATGLGLAFGLVFSPGAGLSAAAVVLPTYVGLVVVLHRLVASFSE